MPPIRFPIKQFNYIARTLPLQEEECPDDIWLIFWMRNEIFTGKSNF
jgi:hypothetical protein